MTRGTDFNDLHVAEGLETVGQQLRDALNAARQDKITPLTHRGDIRDLMLCGAGGVPKNCQRNIEIILENDRHWIDVLAYDAFAYRVTKLKSPPISHLDIGEWMDLDTLAFISWIAQRYGFEPSEVHVSNAVVNVAAQRSFHPVRAYLETCQWDSGERLDIWAREGLGVDDDPAYVQFIARKFLIGAVARVMVPGCKMDNVLILEGTQGRHKSTALNVLFGEWFSDAPIVLGDKDAYQNIHGVWGQEMPELDSFNRAESTTAKAFFSQTRDRFRPPYGHRAEDHKRQSVFMGTTNQSEYFKDYTGNRRYWPMHCTCVDLDWLREHRDQLWAEAAAAYRRGEPWWPNTDVQRELCHDAQDLRLLEDPWEHFLQVYLGNLPKNFVSSDELLTEAIKLDPGHIQRQHQNRLAVIMKSLNWRKERHQITAFNGKKEMKRGYARP